MTNTTDAAQAPTTDERVLLPGRARVTLAHTRAQVLELTRTPIAIISTTIFPTMAFLFFVLPQQEVTRDPIASLVVVAQLGMFGVMSSYLFGYGI
ncbi:MAG: ABC transporter permease, partial [Lapillicoccus sp.]